MRIRAALSGIFASVAILIVGWQAGLAAVTHATVASSIGENTGASTSTSTGTAASPSSSAAAEAATPDAPADSASGSFIVSSVSGATYTSDAYLTSLQSALDQAVI
ncbi:hypothetical protein [Frigoribacterium sp. CG_9.8]|uniref:hypothetical protein n=1 Tax=Frigoribacterium sp. CG_9.8 TaxID=2787733 RepID=UPI001A1AC18C|nr:hypothetical protein [Frigoribacterium sp. CG_9.8]